MNSEKSESAVDQEECEADLNVDACVDANCKHHHPIPKLAVTMPSSHVVEISQTFYWPLYSRPLSWIYQHLSLEDLDSDEVERNARIAAEHLHSLEFFQPIRKSGNASVSGLEDVEESFIDVTEATISRIHHELLEEKDDWFSDAIAVGAQLFDGGVEQVRFLARADASRRRPLCADRMLRAGRSQSR